MPAPDLIGPFYDSGGVLVGLAVNGMLIIPNTLASGIAMQDSSGQWWVLQVGTDGRLGVTPVTF